MTTITPDLARRGSDVPFDHYLNHSHGIKSWLFTLDHKRIGVMYLIAILIAFFVAGVFAMLIRTQLLFPDGAIFTSQAVYKHYNQVFTRFMPAPIMVFLVLVPGIPPPSATSPSP